MVVQEVNDFFGGSPQFQQDNHDDGGKEEVFLHRESLFNEKNASIKQVRGEMSGLARCHFVQRGFREPSVNELLHSVPPFPPGNPG